MTKPTLLFVFLTLFRFNLFSQNVAINVNGNVPNSKALLDIDVTGMSTKAGLLIPRMNTAERDAISTSGTTPESLLIYNTTTHCFESYYNGNWVAFGCIGCQLPGAFSASAATNITATSFSANWTASAGATGYFLDVSTSSTFASFVTDYNNLPVSNVVTYSVNTNLTCNTTYYYRVRANNSCGTSANSGTISQLTSSCFTCGSMVNDVDGNSYNTVLIGAQCWMKENLKTTKYQNSTAIPNVTGGTWDALSTGAYTCYNNDCPTYNATFGKLYNWYAATDANGLCPSGWHVPSDVEWCTLENTVEAGTDPGCNISSVYRGTNTGAMLKETGTTNWQTPNTGTNTTNFTARGGGGMTGAGPFNVILYGGHWWTTTPFNSSEVWYRRMYNDQSGVFRYHYPKTYGQAIRCVKD